MASSSLPSGEPSKRNRPAYDSGQSAVPIGPSPQPVDTATGVGGSAVAAQSAAALPQRPGEQECMHYLRTGFCAYGVTCRYHHPAARESALAAVNGNSYPNRPGTQACPFYMKTGQCK